MRAHLYYSDADGLAVRKFCVDMAKYLWSKNIIHPHSLVSKEKYFLIISE